MKNNMQLSRSIGCKPVPCKIQKFKLSHPISLSLEDITQNAKNLANPKIDEYVGDDVKAFVASENRSQPYTDIQIVQYLCEKGYSVTKQDVAVVRESLGINPSSERYKQYRLL